MTKIFRYLLLKIGKYQLLIGLHGILIKFYILYSIYIMFSCILVKETKQGILKYFLF